jgi:hypothetical protein
MRIPATAGAVRWHDEAHRRLALCCDHRVCCVERDVKAVDAARVFEQAAITEV